MYLQRRIGGKSNVQNLHIIGSYVGAKNFLPLPITPILPQTVISPKNMKFNPGIHRRKSIRLKNYDYSQAGLYFITICTHERLPLFGEIVNGEMILNEAGRTAENCWRAIPDHFPDVTADEFIVMPNHVHGIITITVGANNMVRANNYLPQHGTSKTIGSIVRGFKIGVTQWFRSNTDIDVVWQHNYYEHIIRNETAYMKIVEYIQTNPQRWLDDTYYV
ncbi:MAG: transposase [Methylococcaceae bacterium]